MLFINRMVPGRGTKPYAELPSYCVIGAANNHENTKQIAGLEPVNLRIKAGALSAIGFYKLDE